SLHVPRNPPWGGFLLLYLREKTSRPRRGSAWAPRRARFYAKSHLTLNRAAARIGHGMASASCIHFAPFHPRPGRTPTRTANIGRPVLDRRDFLALSGLGLGGLVLPSWLGKAIAAEELLTTLDPAIKKSLADAGLQAATGAGASYCDVRIGRYLRQFVMTREDKVQNVVNTESTGVGVRVIADGAWGFAATNALTPDAVAQAARQATAIAKANAGIQTEAVQLAPVRGVGEVSWRTPIGRNAMEVPVKEKVDLLLGVNAAAMNAGAD